jgi:DNA-binding MarR family transcriptional regulator
VTAARLDPLIHPPQRLQIMAVLAGVHDAEFALLRQTVGVSDSVLSKHLSLLAEAGYVRVSKSARDGRQRTWASITRQGRAVFAAHAAALRALVAAADLAPIDEPKKRDDHAPTLQTD